VGISKEEDEPMSKPICTVLMAAYNAEKYIAKSLDSLVNQTLKDIEVIVIDDCSSDKTPLIIKQYAVKYSIIRYLLLPENQGQAHARNEGLKIANGQYITFLDSDDWLSEDALEAAVEVFDVNPLTDCVLFHVVNYENDQHQEAYPMPEFEVMTGRVAFEKSLSWQIHGVYMVRATIHKKIPYDETCRSYSDDNTTRMHYLLSREVRQCNGTYFYRQHETSVTHKIDVSRYDYLKANAHMKAMLIDLKEDERILNLYENERWLNVIGLYKFYFLYRKRFSKAENSYGLSEIKKAWKSIETKRLTLKNRLKFGYIPMQLPCLWPFFRLQEELYFALRRLFRRL
jgi:glycosyltransferase involved in cell wall biosynthesis